MLNTMPKRETYPQQELAQRLVHAMEEADVNLAELARGCNVTIQAVYDWRLTGRIGKHHLMTICRLTKKPLEYFLVGLGRAAAVFLVALFMLLQPAVGEASPLNITNYALCPMLRRMLRRLVLAFLYSARTNLTVG
jgi:hypothetical protein